MNEDKSPKVCPLLKQHCLESSCAWYMQGCRRCAMLVMGEAGEIATTTAIIIPQPVPAKLPPLESLSADAEDYQVTGKKALLP